MASADGGTQEPGGSQQAVPDPFPYEKTQIAMASADGGQQEPGGSQLAVPDGPHVPGGGQHMPEHLTI